jgi:AraC-like DNA-binding protein
MFNSKMYLPDLKLTPWIKVYWFLKGEGNGNEYKKRYILPDGCATIVFVLEGEMFLETYSKGVLKKGIYIIPPTLESHFDNISNNISLIDVQLNPGVFYELFNMPIEELEDKVYSFDDLSINFNSNILDIILEKRDSRVKLIRELNRFFLNLFNKNEFSSNDMLENINALYESNSLEEFYESQSLSPRQIQRKVKYITGLSPKMISRIARFNNVLKDLKNSKSRLEFANIAFNYDYSDQSHFIRDFKSFTRNSPKAFLEKSQNYLQYKAIKNSYIKE